MRNGSGTYTVPNTFVASTRVLSADVNQNFSDIASEITNSLAVDGQSSMAGQFKSYSGTVSAPGMSWASETDSGWYRAGLEDFRFAVAGADVFKVTSAGATITGTLTVSGAITGTASAALMADAATTSTRLDNGAAQSFFPFGVDSYVGQSNTPIARIGLVYNAASTAGWLQGDSGGMHFTNAAGTDYTLTVDDSGNLTATGSVTQFSDERLKSDVETITGALAMVEAMRGVRFTRTSTGRTELGVIAQEVQQVAPEVVFDGTEYLSVAYANLVSVLIEATKELSARVAALEARL